MMSWFWNTPFLIKIGGTIWNLNLNLQTSVKDAENIQT